MKKSKTPKFKFMVLLLAVVICGVLIGTGSAMASIYQGLSVGWNYIGGSQSDPPHWSYNVDAWEWLKSDKTRVDFDRIRYYNGQGASNPYRPYFQETLVYDQHYNDVATYWDFNLCYIQGINRTCNPDPDFVMDTISSSNSVIVIQQYIKYVSRSSDDVITWVSY